MNMQAIPAPGAAEGVETLPTDLVSLSDCAKAIGKNKSTVSRQLGKGLFRNWGTAEEPKVSIAEVKAARAAGINPAQQREKPAKAAVPASGYQHERAERERINRQRDELSLAEKLGQVLVRQEVEDDLETLGRSLRERLRQRAQTLLLELEQLPTLPAKVARLIEADEQLLADLTAELESLSGAAGV